MRRSVVPLCMLVLVCGCAADAPRVELRSDDDRDVLAYDCGSPGSHVAKPTAARVFEDYALRIARRSAEAGDTAMLRELMVAYERKDWAALERLVVADACVAGALAASPARFPDPASSPPEFELALVGGDGRLALGALRGRIVVLDFWATWCIPFPQTFVVDRYGMLMASPHQPRRRIWLHELLELAGIEH